MARPHTAASCAEVSGDPADLVIILCKSAGTVDAAHDALAVVGPGSLVVSLQNGLGHETVLAGVFGPEQVIGGKTYAGGVMLAPGRVMATVSGKRTIIGELSGGQSPRCQALAHRLTSHGVPCEASARMASVIWDELLVNVATGALTALTRMTYGEIYATADLRLSALAAVAEAMNVARARGIPLSIASPDEAWAIAAAGLPENFRTSMLQTLEQGRRSEIDFINGAVVREGDALGIATPINRLLAACIHGVENSRAFARIDCPDGERR
jgi:2-dehydropantoate 2-reductase